MPKLKLFVLLVLSVVVFDVAAQGMPGGGGRRGGGGREMGAPPRDRESRREEPNIAARAIEPYGALERELPSLKLDLMIRAEQLDVWRIVERDIRDIAEMERARKRHLLALKGSDKSHTALTFVSSMAEDDRLRAEAAADLKRHFEALYALLDDRQRAMLDRRVIQSQDDPLGQERARPNQPK